MLSLHDSLSIYQGAATVQLPHCIIKTDYFERHVLSEAFERPLLVFRCVAWRCVHLGPALEANADLFIYLRPKLFVFFIPCVRSEEHTSELPSLMRTSSAVFCLTTQPPHH